MKISPLSIIFGFIGIAVSNSLIAHHGLSQYDTRKTVQIKGQVVGFKLQDPHSLLFVDVNNDDGTVTHWTIEGGAGSGIAKHGITKAKLASKPRIIVHGYAGRDNTCKQDCKASGLDFIFE